MLGDPRPTITLLKGIGRIWGAALAPRRAHPAREFAKCASDSTAVSFSTEMFAWGNAELLDPPPWDPRNINFIFTSPTFLLVSPLIGFI